MKDIKRSILDISHNYYNYLINLENVNGVGLGYKRINGITTKELCIHVLVENKVNEKYLTKNNIIPKTYMGIKTDIIEIGKCSVSNGEAIPQKLRPLQGGCGISLDVSPKTAGTLGCFVYKENNGRKEYYILTNNHVITNNQKAPIGTPIIQPSFLTGGVSNEDEIAYLTNYVRIESNKPNKEAENYVDCAIAKVYNRSLISSKVKKLGRITGSNIPDLNIDVQKVGFISGLMKGFITTIGLSLKIRVINNEVSTLKEQFLISVNNTPGDSGSVVLNSDNEVVGLTFATTVNGQTIANDINNVLSKLNVKIYATKKLAETPV